MKKIDFKSVLIGVLGSLVLGMSINAAELVPEHKSAIPDEIHGIWVYSPAGYWKHQSTYSKQDLARILHSL